MRLGRFGISDWPLDTILYGLNYQFTVWFRKKPTTTLSSFEFDISDRATNRCVTDENGDMK